MAQLRFTSAAGENIAEIAGYIGQQTGSRRLAESFMDQVELYCQKLAALPGTMGRARPELGKDLRSSALKSYIIFFRYTGDILEVVNVLEGHRDFEAFFSTDGE
jgi:toxin ParE1/3/4